jgi:riboflavin synthase
MFSGIIESLAPVVSIHNEGSGKRFKLNCDFLHELYIDQSISHNGVCLTVVNIDDTGYEVVAIEETLLKTNIAEWKVGDIINLERAISSQSRMDGHFVQGHVDTTTLCTEVQDMNGSWYFTFAIKDQDQSLLVPKGSICINGVSLTVVDISETEFRVAIIPYTFEHTNFKTITKGDKVNLEFDILGKYITKYLDRLYSSSSK